MPQDAQALLRQLRRLRSNASKLQLKLRDGPNDTLSDKVEDIDQNISQLELSLKAWLHARGR